VSLSSVAQTAMSGISAAQSMMRVIANNMANSQTPGFKASKPSLATQPPQTASLGAAPSAGSGGSNPVQIGNGVRVAGISTDFTQGSITAGGVELSNVDVGENLIGMSQASNLFRANMAVLDTTDELLDELIHLGRE